jgi:hypothetical protein
MFMSKLSSCDVRISAEGYDGRYNLLKLPPDSTVKQNPTQFLRIFVQEQVFCEAHIDQAHLNIQAIQQWR